MKLSGFLSVLFLYIPFFLLRAQGILDKYDFNSEYKQVELNHSLNEISGLTFLNGRLFAHNDESAAVFQVDEYSGKILKKFTVGNPAIADDFEEIAATSNKLYLITSRGDLYMFSEGKDGGNAGYKKFATGITKGDIEGLCYDESSSSLLIALKGSAGKSYKGYKVIYSYDLTHNKAGSEPKFKISLDEIKNKYGLKTFSPSAIVKNKKSGTYFVLSSRDKAIAELSSAGKILSLVKLDEYRHNQPEGIAFSSDGTLIISDEGGNDRATLTRYGLKK
jgi:uncharacterized protein YjiK